MRDYMYVTNLCDMLLICTTFNEIVYTFKRTLSNRIFKKDRRIKNKNLEEGIYSEGII